MPRDVSTELTSVLHATPPPPPADELQDAPVAAVSIGTSAQFATLLSPADSASLEAGDAPAPPPASGDGELDEDVEATERAQRRRGNAAWFLAVMAMLVSWGMGWGSVSSGALWRCWDTIYACTYGVRVCFCVSMWEGSVAP